MKTFKVIFLSAVLMWCCSTGTAQIKSSPYEIGINAGTGLYTGDLTPTLLSPYKSPGLFLGFKAAKSSVILMQYRQNFPLARLKPVMPTIKILYTGKKGISILKRQ